MRAVGHRVLVIEDHTTEYTPSGLFIPNQKEPSLTGVVISVGNGAADQAGTFLKADVEVGDRVMFRSLAGALFTHEGQKYLSLEAQEIIAILGDEGDVTDVDIRPDV